MPAPSTDYNRAMRAEPEKLVQSPALSTGHDALGAWLKAITPKPDASPNDKVESDRAKGAQSWLDLHRDPKVNAGNFKVK